MASPGMVPPPPKRRIHTGAIMLILVGAAFLLYNFGFTFPWFHLYARWWPLLLVLIGVLKLLEYYQARRDDSYSAGVGFGTIVLMIFIILTGLSAAKMTGVNWRGIGDQMGISDEDWPPRFGNSYTYEDRVEQDFPSGGSLKIVNDRGSVNVNSSDDGKIRVLVHKRVWAGSQEDADSANAGTKPQIQVNGTSVTVNANTSNAGNKDVQADMDVFLPRKAEVTLDTRRGDVNVVSRDGTVRLSHQRGQANVEDINGDVFFTCDRVSVRATRIAGSLTIQGRVEDLNVEGVSGNITLEGDSDNDVRLAKVDKSVKFKSPRTDIELAAVQGDFSMDNEDLRASAVAGPVKILTQSKEIQLSDVSGDVRIEDSNADIQLQVTKPGNYDIRNRRGDIMLIMPAKAAFSIDGNTRHGDVNSDFSELRVTNTDADGRITGTLGKGGPHLQISNDGADINIRRAGAAGPVPPAPPAPAVPAAGRDGIVSGAWYNVVNKSSGNCVDNSGWGTSSGSAVQQWECNAEGQENQEWQFQQTDDGYYRVVNRHAKSLGWDALRWGTENGTRVHLWEYVGGTNQQWKPVPVGNGYYKFVGRASGRCFDVPAGTTRNGVQMQIYDCNGSDNQAFRLVRR